MEKNKDVKTEFIRIKPRSDKEIMGDEK